MSINSLSTTKANGNESAKQDASGNKTIWSALESEAKSPSKMTWEDLLKFEKPSFANQQKPTARKVEYRNMSPENPTYNKEKSGQEKRKQLISTYEYYADHERTTLGTLSEELKKAGLKNVSPKIEEYSAGITRIDKSDTPNIIGNYIDARFSMSSDKPRQQEDILVDYQHTTRQRAEALNKTMGDVSKILAEDYGLKDTASQLEKMMIPKEINKNAHAEANSIPLKQMALSRTYEKYFNDPSERNKNLLEEQIKEYTKLVRKNLDELAGTIPPNLPQSSALQSILGGFGQFVQRGYMNMYEATTADVDYNKRNIHENTPQEFRSFREKWSTISSQLDLKNNGYKPVNLNNNTTARRPSMLSTEGIV